MGIDEYGNFLNGTYLVSGYTGTNVATGDNSAYGYGYKPGRIGLRGAGNVSCAALTAAYGTNPGSNGLPYYPIVARDVVHHFGRHLQRRHRQLHRHLFGGIHVRLDDRPLQQGVYREAPPTAAAPIPATAARA